MPQRFHFRLENLHLLHTRHGDRFDAWMAKVPDLETFHALVAIVGCVPQHGVNLQLLNVISRPIVGPNTGFQVYDGGGACPTINEVVFTLEPMVGMDGVHRKRWSIGVDEPGSCNLPCFRPRHVSIAGKRMRSWKRFVREPVGRRPWPTLTSSPPIEARSTSGLTASLHFTEVETQRVQHHFQATFLIDLSPVARSSLVVFPKRAHPFKGRGQMVASALEGPGRKIIQRLRALVWKERHQAACRP